MQKKKLIETLVTFIIMYSVPFKNKIDGYYLSLCIIITIIECLLGTHFYATLK